jgi:hypothetical protein
MSDSDEDAVVENVTDHSFGRSKSSSKKSKLKKGSKVTNNRSSGLLVNNTCSFDMDQGAGAINP